MIYNKKYNKMEEIYKVIEGFENYSVSNLGNVKNNTTNKILKPYPDSGGYYQVGLSKTNKKTCFLLHRLVGLQFLDSTDEKLEVDHIDNDRSNNKLINLRWATRSQNNYNRAIQKNNTSGTKGISFNKNKNKWEAYIRIDGIKITLGKFTDKQDAINARVQKANEICGIYTNKCEKIINV